MGSEMNEDFIQEKVTEAATTATVALGYANDFYKLKRVKIIGGFGKGRTGIIRKAFLENNAFGNAQLYFEIDYHTKDGSSFLSENNYTRQLRTRSSFEFVGATS